MCNERKKRGEEKKKNNDNVLHKPKLQNYVQRYLYVLGIYVYQISPATDLGLWTNVRISVFCIIQEVIFMGEKKKKANTYGINVYFDAICLLWEIVPVPFLFAQNLYFIQCGIYLSVLLLLHPLYPYRSFLHWSALFLFKKATAERTERKTFLI